jgi:N-methylhydantoinase A
MSWSIGVDVGGTFTDFHARDGVSGATRLHKRASTPGNPAEAVLAGLGELGRDIALDALARFSHGTTVATNALIQRRGGKVALIVTKGFRDLIEIGRQVRPRMFDLQADHPPPLVPRERRFELDERITAGGRVIRPLDERSLAAAVAGVRESGADACAVCLLFSFLDPGHEHRVGAALRAALPDLHVSLSCEVQPEFREYERLSTTVLNAYLQSVMARYLADLEREVGTLAPMAAIGINQSSGGLMSISRARSFPVRTALSGPAAGAMGALHMARLSAVKDVITLDMGGTSADVALIRSLTPTIGHERWIEGYPARMPAIDINAVGAGGGSIAWFDRDGLLKVGPRSAGALPGPACYGRGGTEATVSDANLVLGRLSTRLLDGGMTLDLAAARAAIRPLAERLGYGIERTAHGMIGIVVANMVRAIRAVSVERGHDPRDFVLLPFGGAGPLHAGDVARALGIARMLIPRSPGILCAEGLLVSDLSENFVRTAMLTLDAPAIPRLVEMIGALRGDAEAWFATERIAAEQRELVLSLDMRHVGQNFELGVPIDAAAPPALGELRQQFLAAHERSYGFANPDDPIEVVNLRLSAYGRVPRAAPPEPPGKSTRPTPQDHRDVWFDWRAPEETAVYHRGRLRPGDQFEGPAVVEQLDATTVIHPGDQVSVDGAGNMLIEVRS